MKRLMRLIPLLMLIGMPLCLSTVVSADSITPDSWDFHKPDGTQPFGLGGTGQIFLWPDNVTVNTPDSGYVLDVTLAKGYGTPYEEAEHNFSIFVGPATGTEQEEMGQFHQRHLSSSQRIYHDGAIALAIGNNPAGSGGAQMDYTSQLYDGTSRHTGSAAIVNVCGRQYVYEIWNAASDGGYGENFGALVHQTLFFAC